jgi:hypothetical protein
MTPPPRPTSRPFRRCGVARLGYLCWRCSSAWVARRSAVAGLRVRAGPPGGGADRRGLPSPPGRTVCGAQHTAAPPTRARRAGRTPPASRRLSASCWRIVPAAHQERDAGRAGGGVERRERPAFFPRSHLAPRAASTLAPTSPARNPFRQRTAPPRPPTWAARTAPLREGLAGLCAAPRNFFTGRRNPKCDLICRGGGAKKPGGLLAGCWQQAAGAAAGRLSGAVQTLRWRRRQVSCKRTRQGHVGVLGTHRSNYLGVRPTWSKRGPPRSVPREPQPPASAAPFDGAGEARGVAPPCRGRTFRAAGALVGSVGAAAGAARQSSRQPPGIKASRHPAYLSAPHPVGAHPQPRRVLTGGGPRLQRQGPRRHRAVAARSALDGEVHKFRSDPSACAASGVPVVAWRGHTIAASPGPRDGAHQGERMDRMWWARGRAGREGRRAAARSAARPPCGRCGRAPALGAAAGSNCRDPPRPTRWPQRM